MRIFSAVLLGLSLNFLGGCAHDQTMSFSKTGATQNQFLRDRYACLQESKVASTTGMFHEGSGHIKTSGASSGGLYVSCMSLRGYRVDPNGALTVPAGSEVLAVD